MEGDPVVALLGRIILVVLGFAALGVVWSISLLFKLGRWIVRQLRSR